MTGFDEKGKSVGPNFVAAPWAFKRGWILRWEKPHALLYPKEFEEKPGIRRPIIARIKGLY